MKKQKINLHAGLSLANAAHLKAGRGGDDDAQDPVGGSHINPPDRPNPPQG